MDFFADGGFWGNPELHPLLQSSLFKKLFEDLFAFMKNPFPGEK